MKKTAFITLLAAPLILASCGNSEVAVTKPSGTQVEESTVKTHLAKASEGVKNSKAFGIKLEASGEYLSSTSYSYGGSTSEVETTLKLPSFSAEVAIEDITVTDSKDLKASLATSGSLSMASKVTTDGASTNASASTSTDVKGYIADGYYYIDASSMASFLNSNVSSGSSESYKFKAPISDSSSSGSTASNPISTNLDFSTLIDNLKSVSTDYSPIENNGVYSYVFDLDPVKMFSDSTDSSTSGYTYSSNGDSFAYISFTDEHFTEMGFTFGFKQSQNFVTSTMAYSASASVSLSAKASFLYGEEVNVKEVSDPDSYSLSSEQPNFSLS